MITDLQSTKAKIEKRIEAKKKEIKARTQDLQSDLSEMEMLLTKINREIVAENTKAMNDESIHPMERFILWMDSDDKRNAGYIIDGGPLREIFFAEEHRYKVINIVDRLYDAFGEIGYYVGDNTIGMDLSEVGECKEQYDSLSKEGQDKLKGIIEDAIKQNIGEFTYDW